MLLVQAVLALLSGVRSFPSQKTTPRIGQCDARVFLLVIAPLIPGLEGVCAVSTQLQVFTLPGIRHKVT